MRTNKPLPRDATYNRICEYMQKSESFQDFRERGTVMGQIIIDELNYRLKIKKAHFPLQLIPVIDLLADEVGLLVDIINSIDIVEDQPTLEKNLLLRVLEVTGTDIYEDYMKAKYTLVN